MVLQNKGPQCPRGRRGCAEALTGMRASELGPNFGTREQLLSAVVRVAEDVERIAIMLAARGGGAPVQDAAPGPVVHLALASQDRRGDREALAAELKRLGAMVLPDRELPTDEAAIVAEAGGT